MKWLSYSSILIINKFLHRLFNMAKAVIEGLSSFRRVAIPIVQKKHEKMEESHEGNDNDDGCTRQIQVFS